MSDHERGCAGREYVCTCGYDVRTADRIAQLEAEARQHTLAIEFRENVVCSASAPLVGGGGGGSWNIPNPRIAQLEAQVEALVGALRDMPEPYEYLGSVDLRLIRSYIDARRTWWNKHDLASVKGQP